MYVSMYYMYDSSLKTKGDKRINLQPLDYAPAPAVTLLMLHSVTFYIFLKRKTKRFTFRKAKDMILT